MDPLHQSFDEFHAWLQTCFAKDLIYNDLEYNPPLNATLLPILQKLAADTSSNVSSEHGHLKMVAQMATSRATSVWLFSSLSMVVKNTPALAVRTTKKAECYRHVILWQSELSSRADEKKLGKKQDKKSADASPFLMDPVEKFYGDLHLWLQGPRTKNVLTDILQKVQRSASPSSARKHLQVLKSIAQNTLNPAFSSSNDKISFVEDPIHPPYRILGKPHEDPSPWAKLAWGLLTSLHGRLPLKDKTTPMARCFYVAIQYYHTVWVVHDARWVQELPEALGRAVQLIRTLHHWFRGSTWQGDVSNVHERDCALHFDKDVRASLTPQFIWHPDPSANMPKAKDAQAIMAFNSGPTDVAHMAPAVCYILKDICTTLHALQVEMKPGPRQLYMTMPADDTIVKGLRDGCINAAPDAQSVVILATLKNGQRYAIDLAGAQFGWHDFLVPWDQFVAERVKSVAQPYVLLDKFPTIYPDQKKKMLVRRNEKLGASRFERMQMEEEAVNELVKVMNPSIQVWLGKERLQMVDFLKLDESYEMQLAELCFHVIRDMDKKIVAWKEAGMYNEAKNEYGLKVTFKNFHGEAPASF